MNKISPSTAAHTPAALVRSRQHAWEAWLQPIQPDAPAGSDPLYYEDFQIIREEVAKLSEVNNRLIIETAERLLKATAKDVRVAAYYAYGRLRCDGAEGFADGLELIGLLLDRFGAAAWPSRDEGRKAALEWLGGSTIVHQLDAMQAPSAALQERIRSAIALIAACTSAWPDDARPCLDTLLRRFEHSRGASALRSKAPAHTSPLTATPANDLSPIVSSRELLDYARHMATYLRNKPHGYLAASRMLRCIRWDTLHEIPPHAASGKTRLPGPRAELRSHIKRLLLQKQWMELLARIEAAFAEGANHLWLDLQYYAFIAQEQTGDDYAVAREPTAVDCGIFLQRLPGLEHLLFEDGSPFAESATLEWIARRAMPGASSQDQPAICAPSEAERDWRTMEAQAFELATQQGIDNAFAWLQNLAKGDGERHHFMRQFVMGRIAERVDRPDIAAHLFSMLGDLVDRHQLSIWEPSLAFDVKQHLMRALKLRMNRKDADKSALTYRIDGLLGELTAIDPARAVTLK